MKNDKVVKFQKQIRLPVGVIVFFIISIYVLFHIFSYLTAEQVTVYEVNAGTIAGNRTYQAVAVREEMIVNADRSGSLCYFAGNLDQVGIRSNVYSVDQRGDISKLLSAKNVESSALTDSDRAKLENGIAGFLYDFSDERFQKVYTFQTDLSSDLQQYYSNSVMNDKAAEILTAQEEGDFQFYAAPQPGIVVYQLDGYEGLTMDAISSDVFAQANHDVTNLKTQNSVKEGQPVYKLITSDHWSLVLEITDELAEQLREEQTEYIHLRFLSDNAETWAACSIMEKSGASYLVLALDDSVNRYADQRFLQVELLLSERSGLKIPNSAIVEKEFFTIPKAYAFRGNDTTDPGFLKQGQGQEELVMPDVIYETDEFYYVDSEKLHDGDVLLKPDSSDRYTVGKDKDDLSGVYCVNKGYAVFKRIEPVFKNEDYTIVKSGTSYGIALYDHIALQADRIEENAVIH